MAESFHPVTMETLRKHPETAVRVYADGVYDLFHYGHIEQLKQAKTMFENIYLIVGVVTDSDCLKYKGGPTVMTHSERVKSVAMCPYVDEVIEQPPFYPAMDFIDSNKIDIVAHDAEPYEINEEMKDVADCYAPFKQADRFMTTLRTPLISTTELVHRIVSRAEEYKDRNRKRGLVLA